MGKATGRWHKPLLSLVRERIRIREFIPLKVGDSTAEGNPTHVFKVQHKIQCLTHTWNSKIACTMPEWELWLLTQRGSVLELSTVGAIPSDIIQKSQTVLSPLLGICCLIPSHSKHTPLNHPLFQFANPRDLSFTLTNCFYIFMSVPLNCRSLITRHLTNGPS